MDLVTPWWGSKNCVPGRQHVVLDNIKPHSPISEFCLLRDSEMKIKRNPRSKLFCTSPLSSIVFVKKLWKGKTKTFCKRHQLVPIHTFPAFQWPFRFCCPTPHRPVWKFPPHKHTVGLRVIFCPDGLLSDTSSEKSHIEPIGAIKF